MKAPPAYLDDKILLRRTFTSWMLQAPVREPGTADGIHYEAYQLGGGQCFWLMLLLSRAMCSAKRALAPIWRKLRRAGSMHPLMLVLHKSFYQTLVISK